MGLAEMMLAMIDNVCHGQSKENKGFQAIYFDTLAFRVPKCGLRVTWDLNIQAMSQKVMVTVQKVGGA